VEPAVEEPAPSSRNPYTPWERFDAAEQDEPTAEGPAAQPGTRPSEGPTSTGRGPSGANGTGSTRDDRRDEDDSSSNQ
jgi:hypothetical protein